MSPEEINLLKEEYFHLQTTVEDFDQRALTIKAWSVTTSMAGIGASFLHPEAVALCVLASGASLSFWVTEAMWKVFQQAYYKRIGEIEVAFRTGASLSPLQIGTKWAEAFHERLLWNYLRAFLWPHVSIPHFLIVLGGCGLWALRR